MGSLRDLKRESKKPESETVKFYFRLQELAIEYGNAWTKIAEAIEAEGYRERAEILTSNSLRMRYRRWKQSEPAARLPVSSTLLARPNLCIPLVLFLGWGGTHLHQ